MLINGEGSSKGVGVKLLTISSSPHHTFKRHSGQMISALDSGLKGLGSRPGRVIVLCSWTNILLSQSLLPPRSINGYSKLSGKPDEMMSGNLA